MTAIWFSGTRIFPVAGITPAIGCCVTISSSMALFCAEGVGELVAGAEVAGGVRLHPATCTIALRSVRRRIVCSVFILLLSVQWCGGREFEIEQRHLVIKERLVKAGQRVASCANRIQQIQYRTFTSLQNH